MKNIVVAFKSDSVVLVFFLKSNNINLHKTATIDGICMSALRSGSYTLDSGPRRIQFRVGKCSGHSTTRDAYTGYWNTVSRITVEELPLCKLIACSIYTYIPVADPEFG